MHRINKLAILSLLLSIALFGCTKYVSKKDIDHVETTFSHIDVSITPDFYDISQKEKHPEIIVLEEDDKTLFVDIDRVVESNGFYYLLDSYSARTVVSFNNEGKPYTKYGSVGQGPGEYTFPWDIDILNDTVFILDSNLKKIIKYNHNGEYISEKKLPFHADAFKVLENGKIIYNLMSVEDQSPSLCLSDYSLNEMKYMLPYPKGYKGGLHTPDVFRISNGQLTYYKSPSDTLYIINKDGVPDKGIVFNFKSKGLPEDVKLDFSKHSHTNSNLWFVNNPINMNDSLWVGLVEDGNQQYTIVFSETENKCGGKVFSNKSSVYDYIEPIGSDSNGNLICVLNYDIAVRCSDYDILPDEIRKKLEDGNRALLIHR